MPLPKGDSHGAYVLGSPLYDDPSTRPCVCGALPFSRHAIDCPRSAYFNRPYLPQLPPAPSTELIKAMLKSQQDTVVTHETKSITHHVVNLKVPEDAKPSEGATVTVNINGRQDMVVSTRDFQQYVACLVEASKTITDPPKD